MSAADEPRLDWRLAADLSVFGGPEASSPTKVIYKVILKADQEYPMK